MNLKRLVAERLEAGLAAIGAEECPAIVGPATRPEFGDYQANGAMAAAKRLGRKPRDFASDWIEATDLDGIAARCEVTGPGFVSITVADDLLARAMADSGIERTRNERVVIDYSHPNLAKEMQVHHLRSTIIGDAIARVLEALGDTVIRQNHIGDWGTQFGRLVAHLDDIGEDADRVSGDADKLSDLESFYTQASARFNEDRAFADRARQAVVNLQRGEARTLARWQRYIDISMAHCQAVYDALGVGLKPEHVRGESAYNDDLDELVEDLERKGLLKESDGALCVFPGELSPKYADEFKSKGGTGTTPVIVRKSDGGYLYHSTDLAAVRYRADVLRADRVLYIVDARQSMHFRQLFALADLAEYGKGVSFEHHAFGMMLGPGGQPFKTRKGGGTRLLDLIVDAVERAKALVESKNPALDDDEANAVARAVGIGAVKYADLSKNRTSDYALDWNAMLSFDGNTAPYLQYAYARIMSLFARTGLALDSADGPLLLEDAAEHALAVQIARLQETLEQVAQTAMPHYLCGYLYDLASTFMRFYETSPVLGSDHETSRLLLCRRTAETLKAGLGLLGIDTVDRM